MNKQKRLGILLLLSYSYCSRLHFPSSSRFFLYCTGSVRLMMVVGQKQSPPIHPSRQMQIRCKLQ